MMLRETTFFFPGVQALPRFQGFQGTDLAVTGCISLLGCAHVQHAVISTVHNRVLWRGISEHL